MQHADIIVNNGTILSMDSTHTVLENAFLSISGDEITHIGNQDPAAFKAEKMIDAGGGDSSGSYKCTYPRHEPFQGA
jgi:predicted amidohydrolase YtcJ